MAQDFGDDIGSALLRFTARQVGYAFRRDRNGNSIASDWWKKHFRDAGDAPEIAEKKAAEKVDREQVIVPFGTEAEAAYYAQVARKNGIYAAAHKDKNGNGYLSFAKEDAKAIASLAPEFRNILARLDATRIADTLNHAKPVDKKTIEGLTELTEYPQLPIDVTVIPVTIRFKDEPEKTHDVLFSEQPTEGLSVDEEIFFSGLSKAELTRMVGKETGEDFLVLSVGNPYRVPASRVPEKAPTRESVSDHRADKGAVLSETDPKNHTEGIWEAAKEARASCTDFADFERRMNQKGYGLTEDKKGEVMVYEPASPNQDGTLPPYDRERDWAVSATTLGNDTYKLDVTHKWFEQNTPRTVPAPAEVTERMKAQEMVATNGAMDADGRTPDPESGIKSHDSGDTNPQTATMEAEQTGSDIRPSEIYEEERESLMDSAREMRGSSVQLDSERKDTRTEPELNTPAIIGEEAK